MVFQLPSSYAQGTKLRMYTSSPEQNGRYFAHNISKYILFQGSYHEDHE